MVPNGESRPSQNKTLPLHQHRQSLGQYPPLKPELVFFMHHLKLLFACATLIFSSFAFAGDPIKNLLDNPVPTNLDGSPAKLEQVKAGIIAGCRARGWIPILGQGNSIIASLSVRAKHFAEVEITYSEKTYSVKYKSSKDLDYNEQKQTIHRNYNKWVILLSETIKRELVNKQAL